MKGVKFISKKLRELSKNKEFMSWVVSLLGHWRVKTGVKRFLKVFVPQIPFLLALIEVLKVDGNIKILLFSAGMVATALLKALQKEKGE